MANEQTDSNSPHTCSPAGSGLDERNVPCPACEAAQETLRRRSRTRANWLAAPAYFNLNAACAIINNAFEKGFGCYLVGSSLERRDHRDVDVRYIMDDASFDVMFRCGGERAHDGLWSLMCLSISLWLSQQSGLPVDFQIQRQSDANAKHKGERSALGIFLAYPGELPSKLKVQSDAE
jgi:hypothetical protein